jgi:hypothetical protein
MRKLPACVLTPEHPDYDLLTLLGRSIAARLGMRPESAFAELIVEAIDFVLDPVRTGRTKIGLLDNVEKTFIGLKVEHFLRAVLSANKGARDLEIDGHDVDIKNTVSRSWNWMIPPETFRAEEPVILIAADEDAQLAWMGLLIARDKYLGKPNRDGKRKVLSTAYNNILWLAEGIQWPPNPWAGLDMARFGELREMTGGTVRAAAFFSENLGRKTHRTVIVSLLFDQKDPMKRLRGNGGARDLLKPLGIALLSGKYDGPLARQLGYDLGIEEHVAIRPDNDHARGLLRDAGEIF